MLPRKVIPGAKQTVQKEDRIDRSQSKAQFQAHCLLPLVELPPWEDLVGNGDLGVVCQFIGNQEASEA